MIAVKLNITLFASPHSRFNGPRFSSRSSAKCHAQRVEVDLISI